MKEQFQGKEGMVHRGYFLIPCQSNQQQEIQSRPPQEDALHEWIGQPQVLNLENILDPLAGRASVFFSGVPSFAE